MQALAEQAKPHSKRDTILDRAFDCFQRSGYKKTSMEDVAAAAGVSRAAIYLHFPNKHDLALAMIEHNADRVHEELKRIARTEVSADKRLARILQHRVLQRVDRCNKAAGSLDDLLAAIRQPFLHLREQINRVEAELIAEVLIEGRLAGEFAFDDAFRTAESMVLATNTLMPFSLSARELGDRRELEDKLSRLIEMCLRSVRTERPRAPGPPQPPHASVSNLNKPARQPADA